LIQRTPPDRLRWLAQKIEDDGADQLVRYAVASALIIMAIEMEVAGVPDGRQRDRAGREGGQRAVRPLTDPDPATTHPDGVRLLGWWAISGEALMDMLRRCHQGEPPDAVYAEEYANSEHFTGD
jgi:hypothetical protein